MDNETARCKNCNTMLLGRFCVSCGQSADVHVPTTHELLHELMEGLTHSDIRLWQTLKYLWFRPGKLTQEFVAGRRMAYLPPFRLYLVLSVVFFLLLSLSHTEGRGVSVSDGQQCNDIKFDSPRLYPELNARVQHACREVLRDNGAGLMHVAVATMSKAMFVLLPLIAFLHMLMYWRPRHRYAEHLLFFVHVQALYFSIGIVMLALSGAASRWPAMQGAAETINDLLGWVGLIYTLIAVRRVFAKSWPGAVFKTAALSLVYLVMFSITVVAVFSYALLQI